MAAISSAPLSRDIRTLFEDGTAVGLTDRQLLDRFAGCRDPAAEAAFEALVLRHGPMVLRVCRNALHDPNDAHDAFQATFLILVRRIGALGGLESLGGWLYGVACRVSARARVESARRRAIEGRVALRVVEVVDPADAQEVDRGDLGPVVQEEVRRLPERYRTAVVLCYWEGLTQEQAAAQIGCPLGTVRSRIARARQLLRRRLTRRGVAPMAGIAGSGFDLASVVPTPAAAPDAWVMAMVKVASKIAAGGGPAGVSSAVSFLVQDVLRRMVMMNLKTTVVCLSLVGMGAAGVILASPQVAPNPAVPAAAQGPRADRQKARPSHPTARPDYVIEPPDVLLVDTLDALPGRPISGDRLVRPDGRIGLGFYGDVYVAGLTVKEAKAKIVLHLRNFLSDEMLGLLQRDPKTGDYRRDNGLRLIRKDPADTDRVIVDISGYNSKNIYVLGEVRIPGRYALTGNETVLDALQVAGGLLPGASARGIRLVRPPSPGLGNEQVLRVDLTAITDRGDSTTNYQLMPGDRLIVHANAGDGPDDSIRRPASNQGRPEGSAGNPRQPSTDEVGPDDDGAPRRDTGAEDRARLRDVEKRLGELERQLDRVLQALEQRKP